MRLVPSKETWSWWMAKCRPSAAAAASSRASVGHEPGDGLGDQPVERGGADLVRERARPGRRRSRGLPGEPEGGLGDPAGPPRREVPGLDAGPVPGQPVLQLERVGDQDAAGVGGDTEGEGELGDAELRDQRRTRAGEREAGVPATG